MVLQQLGSKVKSSCLLQYNDLCYLSAIKHLQWKYITAKGHKMELPSIGESSDLLCKWILINLFHLTSSRFSWDQIVVQFVWSERWRWRHFTHQIMSIVLHTNLVMKLVPNLTQGYVIEKEKPTQKHIWNTHTPVQPVYQSSHKRKRKKNGQRCCINIP